MTTSAATPTSVFSTANDVAVYDVSLAFTGMLAGGNPSGPALVEGWLAKNLGIDDEDQLRRWTLKHLAEVQGIDPSAATDADLEAAIEANAAEKKAQVFKRTVADGRPYIEPRQIKALLKEAVSIAYPRGENKWGGYASRSAKRAGEIVGGKEPRAYLTERVFPVDAPIVVADEITGVELAVGHVTDSRTFEKRSTIGYFEYVDMPVISFQLKVLDDCLSDEQWARVWTVAEMNGLGARRSQGCGMFVVTNWNRIGELPF